MVINPLAVFALILTNLSKMLTRRSIDILTDTETLILFGGSYKDAVLMEKLIDIANGLTDMDKAWFPILFLRPKEDERMTNTLVGILSVFYGITGSISLYLILKYFDILSGILPLVILSIALVVGVFIIYRAIFAFSWNSRAERLQAEQGSFQA